jgi:hypothetical protein
MKNGKILTPNARIHLKMSANSGASLRSWAVLIVTCVPPLSALLRTIACRRVKCLIKIDHPEGDCRGRRARHFPPAPGRKEKGKRTEREAQRRFLAPWHRPDFANAISKLLPTLFAEIVAQCLEEDSRRGPKLFMSIILIGILPHLSPRYSSERIPMQADSCAKTFANAS